MADESKNNNDASGDTVQLETAQTFIDHASGFVRQEVPSLYGDTDPGHMPDVIDDSHIKEFLSRKVKIGTFVLPVGGLAYHEIDPWTELLTSPELKRKLQNYMRLRADIIITVNVSATNFHSAVLRLTYRPHPGVSRTSDNVYNFAVASEATAATENFKIIQSQLHGVTFNPAFTRPFELRLPYVHYQPGIELVTGDFSTIGTLALIGFTPLRHANGGTDPITFEFFARLEGVDLSVSTTTAFGYSLTEAAKVTGKYIRRGARALQLANEAVPALISGMAAFGFSRPISGDTPNPVNLGLPFNLANSNLVDSAMKLSLSAAADGDISGAEVGAGAADDLLITTMAARESYISSAGWSTADTTGTFKFGAFVTPEMQNVSDYQKPIIGLNSFDTVSHACQTPAAMIAHSVTHWRGIVCFKVQVACSTMHKGRLRLVYDPDVYDPVLGSPGYNVSYSTVLDLAESNEAVVKVPWMNVRDSCITGSPFDQNHFLTTLPMAARSGAITRELCNGTFIVEVLNPLTAPSNGASVDVVVSTWVEDMVVYGPRMARASNGGPLTVELDAAPWTPFSFPEFDVTGGDAIASARLMMKRYTVEGAISLRTATASGKDMSTATYVAPIYFPLPGYTEQSGAALDVDSNNLKVNPTNLSFRSYYTAAFAIQRGGIRAKVAGVVRNFASSAGTPFYIAREYTSIENLPLTNRRKNTPTTANSGGSQATDAATAHALIELYSDQGAQVTKLSASDMSQADVEFPFVSQYRGRFARGTLASSVDASDRMNFSVSVDLSTANNSYFAGRIWISTAEDYNVFYFMHALAVIDGYPTVIPVPT